MIIEIDEEEREALVHLLWCVQNDMPTRMTMERMLTSVVRYRSDGLYDRIYRKIDHFAWVKWINGQATTTGGLNVEQKDKDVGR